MGAHITEDINRREAETMAMIAIIDATNEELEDLLFKLVGDKKLVKYRIEV